MTPTRGLKMSYSIVLHKNLLGEEIGDETIKIYIYNSLSRLAIRWWRSFSQKNLTL